MRPFSGEGDREFLGSPVAVPSGIPLLRAGAYAVVRSGSAAFVLLRGSGRGRAERSKGFRQSFSGDGRGRNSLCVLMRGLRDSQEFSDFLEGIAYFGVVDFGLSGTPLGFVR